MKSVRFLSLITFCLLTLYVPLLAQEWHKDNVAYLIHNPNEIVAFLNDATPDSAGEVIPVPLVESMAKLGPAKVNFRSVMVGTTSSSKAVKLTNTGTGNLNIIGIAITGNNPGDFAQTNTCPNQLAAGKSCRISVTFGPKTTGQRTATLTVSDDAGGSPQTVALIGTGVAPSCIPLGGSCFGPGPIRCCPAPFPHHSICSSQTGFGVCLMT